MGCAHEKNCQIFSTSYFAIESTNAIVTKKLKRQKKKNQPTTNVLTFCAIFLHWNKHTGSKELVHRIFTACIRKDRLSSSCHYVSKVEVCQILEYPFQRSGGMILGTGDAAKRKQDELNVSVHKAAE